jgi:TRAP-type C4-dicarboxylate transport system substrate-binding protein
MNLVVSKRVWDRLTPQQQTIIREESRRAAQNMRAAIKVSEEGYIARLQQHGMIVTRPNTAPFAALMQPAHEAIARYVGNPDYVPTFLRWVEQLR